MVEVQETTHVFVVVLCPPAARVFGVWQERENDQILTYYPVEITIRTGTEIEDVIDTLETTLRQIKALQATGETIMQPTEHDLTELATWQREERQ
jgi:hypothetical protein